MKKFFNPPGVKCFYYIKALKKYILDKERNQMKKMTVLFLALVMILGSMSAMPMVASAEALTLPSGYTFVDIAHNGDTYVALAKNYVALEKNEPWSVAKLYCSTDGGLYLGVERGYMAAPTCLRTRSRDSSWCTGRRRGSLLRTARALR